MSTQETATQVGRMITVFGLPNWLVALFFLSTYVLLDYVSFIFPLSPFGITPWNPPTGLSFVLILLKGRSYIGLLFVAPLVADIVVRGMPLPLWAEGLAIAVLGCGYGAATLWLLRPKLRFDFSLSTLRDLSFLLLAAGLSSAVVALAYASIFALAGLLPWHQYLAAALHYWVGDAIGVFVVAPFLLSFLTIARLPKPTIEMAAQLVAIVLALWLIFGFARASEFQFFYILFLPIIWIATRFGLEGASVALFVTQAGLVTALDWTDQSVADVAKFQLLMLVLALTGLILGAAISEQRRGLTRLRLHQEALARASRLTSLSALAATLAHELNQPLTAIGNYIRLVRDMLSSSEGYPGQALETSRKAVAQVDHAARLVRQLREFVRTGESELVPTPPSLVIADALELARPILESANVEVDTRMGSPVAPMLVNRLQIEQVLLNVITNSVEAIASTGRASGRIAIEIGAAADHGFIDMRLSDDGPGFADEIVMGPASSFASTKQQGTGVGLTLSRSIVERHGGRLTLENHAQGACVTIRLPSAPEIGHAI